MTLPITIVMTYLNRKRQLLNTLASINTELVKIIIVDDCSDDGQDITYLNSENIKVITLKNKTWLNPCIAFNTGFAQVDTDIVIIQNAENIHVGNIVDHVYRNAKHGHYFNYATYSINEKTTKTIHNGNVGHLLSSIEDKPNVVWGENGWYNHPVHRHCRAHFCSAIMREDLYDMGGFDERFYDGLGFDDNEFLTRIEKKGLFIHDIVYPFVIHQHHNPHFVGYVNNLMEVNSKKWDAMRKIPDYDVKPYNTIYK